VIHDPTEDRGIGDSAPLWNRGFVSLLATQFVEASTDNVVKTLLTIAVAAGKPWEFVFGQGGGGWIGVAFTVPFIVLSAWAGRIADRNSKRSVTVVLKLAAFAVAALAALGFGLGDAWLAMAALGLFAIISAFFGPAKYGMIAELVAHREIARANGVINMATNVAVIVGVLMAGILADEWEATFVAVGATPTSGVAATTATSAIGAWLPGITLAVLVLVGFLTCLTLPRLRPQMPSLPRVWDPISTYVTTIREMSKSPLLAVALAWTFFYFAAAVALLALPDYSKILSVSNAQVSYLMGGLGVSIGISCIVAAWLDRPHRRRLFVPAGALGLAAGFLALGLVPPTYTNVAILVSCTGLVAGFYIIPLQSMLQMLSPDESRGRCLGTANGMSFMMAAIGSAMFLGLRKFGMESNRVFAVLGILCIAAAIITWWRLRRKDLTGKRVMPD
jgi:acyl-[acyl-carrier-protein]-phospholipid O-acyltransferase/long-chain-fatty-acid--[acyl-carrier-protein] ligase